MKMNFSCSQARSYGNNVASYSNNNNSKNIILNNSKRKNNLNLNSIMNITPGRGGGCGCGR
tara:strand:+ start:1254 stop:1436 length:183 start_codon:yes stop_codon:yes gene_type:complete